ncbi:hypothetical protein ACSBOB_10090 [Mesorhizobium sp. ASY16-5R]|uniref:hypothetical protein n=1 Tax=Mesorhizobium sp. ASY16-5R TaxID=3445772 RepID=UPI003FA098EF
MRQVTTLKFPAARRGRPGSGYSLKAVALEAAVLCVLLVLAAAVAALPVVAGVWRHLQ